MAVPIIKASQIKTGPGVLQWAIVGTAAPTVTAVANKLVVVHDAAYKQAGATEGGITINEATTWEEVRVAESQHPVRSVPTETKTSIAGTLSHLSDVNWKLVRNGGDIVVTGTGGTKMTKYTPPLLGKEIRVQLTFHSLDEDEFIWWPEVLQAGSIETSRGEIATKHGLPFEFNAYLPDPAVLALPYQRWVSGALAEAV